MFYKIFPCRSILENYRDRLMRDLLVSRNVLDFWGPFVVHAMRSGVRLNIKMSSYQYRDPHVKDRTVFLNFNMAISIPGKDGLYIKTGPCWCWNLTIPTVGYHIAFYGGNFRHQSLFLTSPAAKRQNRDWTQQTWQVLAPLFLCFQHFSNRWWF